MNIVFVKIVVKRCYTSFFLISGFPIFELRLLIDIE